MNKKGIGQELIYLLLAIIAFFLILSIYTDGFGVFKDNLLNTTEDILHPDDCDFDGKKDTYFDVCDCGPINEKVTIEKESREMCRATYPTDKDCPDNFEWKEFETSGVKGCFYTESQCREFNKVKKAQGLC